MRKVLGSVVVARRNELALTQDACATRMGVSQSQLSKVERGARAVPFDELERLASALELSISELTARAEKQDNANEARRRAGLGPTAQRE